MKTIQNFYIDNTNSISKQLYINQTALKAVINLNIFSSEYFKMKL